MMKRTVLCVAALAILSSVANAAVCQFNILPSAVGSTTGTTNDGNLSTDGKYVAGYGYNTTIVSYAFPVYWTADPDGGTQPVRTDGNGGWGAGGYTGIDHKGTSTVWTGANAGSTVYSANNFTGRYGTPIIAGSLLDHTGASSSVTTGGSNCVAVTADGQDVWIAGTWSAGSSKGNDGQIWMSTGGVLNKTAAYHPTHSSNTKVGISSISSIGNAIGNAKDAVGPTGATGRPRAIYWQPGEWSGTMFNIPTFADNGTTTETQGFGISDDGQKYVGLGWVSGDTVAKGFVWTMGDANAIRLNRPTGGQGTPTVTYAYDVTNGGVVAGNAYMDDGNMPGGLTGNHDVGTIWMPGQTTGTRMIDALLAAGQGVYDPNIRHLGRVYGVAELPDGKLAFSGEGSYWLGWDGTSHLYGTRAWYAVIPEPATMGFLALGGLALLRRRR